MSAAALGAPAQPPAACPSTAREQDAKQWVSSNPPNKLHLHCVALYLLLPLPCRDTLPQGGLWDLLVSMLRSPQQVFVQGPYLTPCFTAASTCAWTRLKGSARIALANPNSGPGTAKDANWQRLINEAQTAGTLMLGYVATSTGTKALATVRSEINKYFQFYPNISGIFVDQVNTACTATPLAYYQNVTAHVRGLNSSAAVIFNWGSGEFWGVCDARACGAGHALGCLHVWHACKG